MSSYNSRRAPNVSQYLAGLNMLPEQLPQNDLTFDDSFDALATLDFFDLDSAGTAFNPPPFPADSADQNNAKTDHQYPFTDFQTLPAANGASPDSSTMPSTPLQASYPAQFSPLAGDKRKASMAGMPSATDLEENSRIAAEEDKRRRNTAASARFRIKKKQREQELEKRAKEMSDKVQALETKVGQLEMENKWLKGLITEKADGKAPDFAAMKSEKESDDRSTEERTDGVGTLEATS